MTEPTPDAPPVDPNEPVTTDPTPVEEEPPGEEQPAVPSDTPCTAVHPTVPGVVCQIQFDNHFAFRLVHTATVDGQTYEWE